MTGTADRRRGLPDRAAQNRSRDATGRPRSARPRDELGRPLPHDADGVEGVPDDIALSPEDSLAEAQRLLDRGRAFHAHEVLESTWKAAPEPERELWRGLAQLAVGLTQAQRGNVVGAAQLLRRAADRVEGYATDPPHGVDTTGLVVWARALAVRVESGGLGGLTQGDLAPHLRRPDPGRGVPAPETRVVRLSP